MGKNRTLPRHILVLRLSAMGDVAMLPHAVGALKSAYPDVHITVVTRPLFKPFFRNLDIEFMPVDVKRDYPGIRGLLKLSRLLRQTGIDAFADEHDVLRSKFLRIVLRLHGIRIATIDKSRAQKRRLLKERPRSGKYLKHTVIRYCDTLRRFGFDFPDPQLPAKVVCHSPAAGSGHGTKVGFAPFSAHQGKTCPDALRRRITALLSERFDRVFIHSGGGAEAEFAREMERTYPNVTAVCDRVKGLGEEMDLISNLDCMVSMDSLAMHLSSLVATPVVSLWGATHPQFGFLGYGCRPEWVIQTDMECRPCSTYGNKGCRFGTYACLHAINAEEVAARVESIVRERSSARHEPAEVL